MKPRSLALFALILLGLVATIGLSAIDVDYDAVWGVNFAYYTDDHRGGAPGSNWFQLPSYVPLQPQDNQAWQDGIYNYSNDDPRSRQLGSGWGSVELESFFKFQASVPFLQGEGLFSSNNVAFVTKPVITPVSFHIENEVNWTPLAFLVAKAGVAFGTGWNFDLMGLQGLALSSTQGSDPDDGPGGTWELPGDTWGGLAGLYYLGGTFQFDLAAVVPGEYNHIVVQATSKARYQHYSKAGVDDPWIWRADGGDNFNGWRYVGEYALGWQPPWKINFIGFLAEHEFWMDDHNRNRSTIADGGWGSDLHEWNFGPVVNFDLGKGHGLTVLLQFKNGLYYSGETVYHRSFQAWETTGDRYLKFNRLALAYSWAL